jgi:MFS family permease
MVSTAPFTENGHRNRIPSVSRKSSPNPPPEGFTPDAIRIPTGIWVLGFVSLLMDLSSEMIHALLPLFMVKALGTPVIAVGVIEGIAEGTAMVTKLFSGVLADRFRKPKLLALLGYGLSALSKPLFPLASGLELLIGARVTDRIGKGIRGAPRDALVAEIAPPAIRGACFGLRQGLDSMGAFFAPLIAIGLMLLTADNYRLVFWIAAIPALLAVLLLAVGITEPESPVISPTKKSPFPLTLPALRRLPRELWFTLILAGLLSLARFSDAFLILRSQQAGLPIAWVPLVMVVMNLIYAASSYPAGQLSDRFGRMAPLLAGTLLLILGNILLASGRGLLLPALGIACWGLHLGLTQGILSAMVADAAPSELKATAFGLLNLMSGLGLLAASLIAGALWDQIGSSAMFLAAVVPAAGVLLLIVSKHAKSAG